MQRERERREGKERESRKGAATVAFSAWLLWVISTVHRFPLHPRATDELQRLHRRCACTHSTALLLPSAAAVHCPVHAALLSRGREE